MDDTIALQGGGAQVMVRTALSVVEEAHHVTAEIAHLLAVAAEAVSGGDTTAQSMMEKALKSMHAAAGVLRKGVGTDEVIAGGSGK